MLLQSSWLEWRPDGISVSSVCLTSHLNLYYMNLYPAVNWHRINRSGSDRPTTGFLIQHHFSPEIHNCRVVLNERNVILLKHPLKHSMTPPVTAVSCHWSSILAQPNLLLPHQFSLDSWENGDLHNNRSKIRGDEETHKNVCVCVLVAQNSNVPSNLCTAHNLSKTCYENRLLKCRLCKTPVKFTCQ